MLQVFEIWQRRQILKASLVAPALQLMAKLRAEHELARAAAEPVVRMGQAVEGRRPMRVNLPCVPPGSLTGLPEYVMHVMLDQWSGLAGFRYATCCIIYTRVVSVHLASMLHPSDVHMLLSHQSNVCCPAAQAMHVVPCDLATRNLFVGSEYLHWLQTLKGQHSKANAVFGDAYTKIR